MKLGKSEIKAAKKSAEGGFVEIGGELFYEIQHADSMPPFHISLASDTDLWMSIASMGELSCGRQSLDKALFPYGSDDQIPMCAETTGAKTILHVTKGGETYLWEPFSDRYAGVYQTSRRVAKSVTGNKIIFTEVNEDLGVQYSYLWTSADAYGWVRKAMLHNLTDEVIEIEVLDGVQNVLPSGMDRTAQDTCSTLVDEYKKTKLVAGTSLVLFHTEAIMLDCAEPTESSRCNTVYMLGLPEADYLTSSRQLDAFRHGLPIEAEPESIGVCGAMLAHALVQLGPKGEKSWYTVADVDKDAAQVRDLIGTIQESDALQKLDEAIVHSTKTLRQIVSQNDGIQRTGDQYNDARHFANVLFNTMHGGLYCDDYQINGQAFAKHVYLFNHTLASKQDNFLNGLPESISRDTLERLVLATEDKQMYRLYMEYLPLTSSRHGAVSYQGRWSDMFQSWEALSLSYPGYINGIIAKFLNATTVDGYNPYKVTSEGIDWEVINLDAPCSNIGYWGDHQIIYLCKLLELSYKHNPEALRELLQKRVFAYANVPYRFKAFDETLNSRIHALIPQYGQDARLVLDKQGEVYLTTFTEKVLVTLLAKLTNFIPEAGIWMNTPRSDWNDASKVLVGNGASMVTLYYMRRYVNFLQHLFMEQTEDTLEVSTELRALLAEVLALLKSAEHCLNEGFTNEQRRNVADSLGKAGDAYRTKAYAGFAETKCEVEKASLVEFLELVQRFIDQSIRVNKRKDGLYNAYNIVSFTDEGVVVKELCPMLEGQVAALSAELLSAAEATELLQAMRHSKLYREDQRSYLLYPASPRVNRHMVSKLLLAVGENIVRADEAHRPALIEAYEAIREGVGSHKKPAEYGSFPFDPFSHTLSMAGVQQSAMTGQVNEEILSRYFELGIQVVDGEIHIDPLMLHEADFQDGRLRFTYCGTEFEYRLGGTPSPRVLDKETSYHIFARDHQIKKIIINL